MPHLLHHVVSGAASLPRCPSLAHRVLVSSPLPSPAASTAAGLSPASAPAAPAPRSPVPPAQHTVAEWVRLATAPLAELSPAEVADACAIARERGLDLVERLRFVGPDSSFADAEFTAALYDTACIIPFVLGGLLDDVVGAEWAESLECGDHDDDPRVVALLAAARAGASTHPITPALTTEALAAHLDVLACDLCLVAEGAGSRLVFLADAPLAARLVVPCPDRATYFRHALAMNSNAAFSLPSEVLLDCVTGFPRSAAEAVLDVCLDAPADEAIDLFGRMLDVEALVSRVLADDTLQVTMLLEGMATTGALTSFPGYLMVEIPHLDGGDYLSQQAADDGDDDTDDDAPWSPSPAPRAD